MAICLLDQKLQQCQLSQTSKEHMSLHLTHCTFRRAFTMVYSDKGEEGGCHAESEHFQEKFDYVHFLPN